MGSHMTIKYTAKVRANQSLKPELDFDDSYWVVCLCCQGETLKDKTKLLPMGKTHKNVFVLI